MLSIDHVGLWVRDLDRVCAFYVEHLGAVAEARYENLGKGFVSRFLRFDSGARIELMTTTILSPVASQPGAERMGLTHLAFRLGSQSEVDATTGRLQSAGTVVLSGPRKTGDGYYESVVLDPEGNRIELVA